MIIETLYPAFFTINSLSEIHLCYLIFVSFIIGISPWAARSIISEEVIGSLQGHTHAEGIVHTSAVYS